MRPSHPNSSSDLKNNIIQTEWICVVICCRFKFFTVVATFLVQTISCLVGCLSSNLDSHSFVTFIVFQNRPMESFNLVLPYYLCCCQCLRPVGLIFILLQCLLYRPRPIYCNYHVFHYSGYSGFLSIISVNS